jgi:hypothetical protein
VVVVASPLPPPSLVGGGAHGDGVFDLKTDLDAFAVIPDFEEPAVALFGSEQQNNLVFRTKQAVLTPPECAAVVAICDAHATANGGWGTVRHSSVHTTDVAVEDIPVLRCVALPVFLDGSLLSMMFLGSHAFAPA